MINETQKERKSSSLFTSQATQQKRTVPLHGLVVPTSKGQQAKRPKRTPRRVQRVKTPADEAARFRMRLAKLKALGVNPAVIKGELGLSYSGLRGIMTGSIRPSTERLPGYHATLDKWCNEIAAV